VGAILPADYSLVGTKSCYVCCTLLVFALYLRCEQIYSQKNVFNIRILSAFFHYKITQQVRTSYFSLVTSTPCIRKNIYEFERYCIIQKLKNQMQITVKNNSPYCSVERFKRSDLLPSR